MYRLRRSTLQSSTCHVHHLAASAVVVPSIVALAKGCAAGGRREGRRKRGSGLVDLVKNIV